MGLEISSGLALNVGATLVTAGQAPLGAIMVGAAAAILAGKQSIDHYLGSDNQHQVEDALKNAIEKYGNLRAAVRAIADGLEVNSLLSAARARELLQLDENADLDSTSPPDNELLIYIGQWIEQWCATHSKRIEDIRPEILALSQQNLQEHAKTQKLVEQISYFVPFEDYFRPFLDSHRLFRHDWGLVGRSELLAEVKAFVQTGQARVGILFGRGGIGKSKILYSAIEQLRKDGWTGTVLFVPEHIPLSRLTVAELPPNGSLIVVDDAHRYADFLALLDILQVHRPSVRLLLVTRPHAMAYLQSSLILAKYDTTQIQVFTQITELSRADVKALAEQALGERFKHLSDLVVELTWDSPLVTVIAGQLVAREALSSLSRYPGRGQGRGCIFTHSR